MLTRLLVAAILPAGLLAQTPVLVKDINTIRHSDPGSAPADFVRLGSMVLLTATTAATGRELYATRRAAALRGLRVVLQAVTGPTRTALGTDLTNGLLLTLGT